MIYVIVLRFRFVKYWIQIKRTTINYHLSEFHSSDALTSLWLRYLSGLSRGLFLMKLQRINSDGRLLVLPAIGLTICLPIVEPARFTTSLAVSVSSHSFAVLVVAYMSTAADMHEAIVVIAWFSLGMYALCSERIGSALTFTSAYH